jgi:TldD protein
MENSIMLQRCLAAVVLAAGVFGVPLPARAQSAEPAPVLHAMKAELARSLAALKTQPEPPYYLSYEVTDQSSVTVSGSFGYVTGSSESRSRVLGVDLRVGDYTLDNTREIRGAPSFLEFGDRFSLTQMSIDDDPAAIRSLLWLHTDRKYKQSVERFTRVRANVQLKVEADDKSADFSKEPVEKFAGKLATLTADRRAWEGKIRKYTAPFARNPKIYLAQATFSARTETRWFVSSEGSEIQTSEPRYQLFLSAMTKAEDGMELPRFESFFSFTPEGMPDDAKVLAVVEQMIQDLEALRKAPVVDPFAGPAILSGRASGVFFHEVFGHRIEGHRQKVADEGQTFRKKINENVLPEDFSVYFDPTQKRLGSTDLVGTFEYDDQGVKARRVVAVDRGVFKSFLMSRSPIEGFLRSNGHGRGQPGFAPVARQSILIVDVANPVSTAELKKMLVDEVKRQNKPFGLWFDDIQGGFTLTGRTIPNAFNVLPVMVYRLYPDGREELVRGVDLIGTPLAAFSKLVAGDNQLKVFNGICGAESGGVPVSAVSPSVLVSQIEVQKKEKSQERLPILEAPSEEKR